MRHDGAGDAPQAGQVDVDHRDELFFRHLGHGPVAGQDAGIVDEDVDAPERHHRRGDEAIDLRLVADVAHARHHACAGRAQLAGRIVEIGRPDGASDVMERWAGSGHGQHGATAVHR